MQIEESQRVWPKSYMTMGNKNAFFLIFDIYYVALNVVTYVMSYTVYASQVKFLLRLELIKAYINVNFKFHCFSAYCSRPL